MDTVFVFGRLQILYIHEASTHFQTVYIQHINVSLCFAEWCTFCATYKVGGRLDPILLNDEQRHPKQ